MKDKNWKKRITWIGIIVGLIVILGLTINRSIGIYLPLRIPAFWILILLLSGIGLTLLAGVLDAPYLVIPAVIFGSIGSFILFLGFSRFVWRFSILVLAGSGIAGMIWMFWNQLKNRERKKQGPILPLSVTAMSLMGIFAVLIGFGRSWIVLLPLLLLPAGFLAFLIIKNRSFFDPKRSDHDGD